MGTDIKCPCCNSEEVDVLYDQPFMLAGSWLTGDTQEAEKINMDWELKPEIYFDTTRYITCKKCRVTKEDIMRVIYKIKGTIELRDE